jgi:hypothetical protein
VAINCQCSDATGYRTLAQLRTALIERLGFADPVANVETRTLASLRTDMLHLMGYGAVAGAPTPGINEQMNAWLNMAQQVLFRRLELDKGGTALPARMVNDTDTTTLDANLVFAEAMAMATAAKGRPDTKAYREQVERAVSDIAARRPPGLVPQLNTLLREAQDTIMVRYPALRTERWFSWPLTAGERFYNLPDNAEQTATPACTKQLDPNRVTWVGYQRDTVRVSLRAGIPPQVIGYDMSGWPERYEIRQCIEIWPAPDATAGTLLVKGRFKVSPFTADADVATVDDHAIFLLALANAKSHYKQPDAQTYYSQFQVHLEALVAGTHTTRRYLPGTNRDPVYVEPRPSVPFP